MNNEVEEVKNLETSKTPNLESTNMFDIEKNKQYVINNLMGSIPVNPKVIEMLSKEDLFKYAVSTMKKMCENNISSCTTDSDMMDTLNKLNLCIMSIAKTDNIHTVSIMLKLTKILYEKLLQKQSFFCLSQVTYVESFMTKVPTKSDIDALNRVEDPR